ncbi:unnamed protein product [Soboliphyme baturini]|uniref:CHRD domain-containing protein n=1 Tax=Soboliphyme baturini TaxID=241478 RepID=A0A183ICF9_9BILA|nr:unnamed protein product [Soboliphyme baturini]
MMDKSSHVAGRMTNDRRVLSCRWRMNDGSGQACFVRVSSLVREPALASKHVWRLITCATCPFDVRLGWFGFDRDQNRSNFHCPLVGLHPPTHWTDGRVHKKRRIIGRVICKNFIKQCPKPDCPNPIALPGQCCKTCLKTGPMVIDVFEDSNDKGDYVWGAGYHEFMALMTGRFRTPAVMTEGIGRAYITLDGSRIHISVYTEKLDESPLAIQVLDGQNAILFEKSITGGNMEKPMCAFWSKVPKMYIQSLKKHELQITLVTEKQPEGVIGGSIRKHKILHRETFTGLLFPHGVCCSIVAGYGAVVAVEVQGSNAETLHIVGWLNANPGVGSEQNNNNNNSDSDNGVVVFFGKDGGRQKQFTSSNTKLVSKVGFYQNTNNGLTACCDVDS